MLQWEPFFITFKLALFSTIILLILGIPLAWWLTNSTWRFKAMVEAAVALPFVLPPTVLGFYLLLALSPDGVIGTLWAKLSDNPLTFSFSGLVIGSVFYSLPFVVQPLQTSFAQVDRNLLMAAKTLGAKPLDLFSSIVVPLSKRGFIVALTLGFAHTVGEFGVVLMIGGNIPGLTQVLSIVIYDHVESLEYGIAHLYSLILLLFSFVVLVFTYSRNRKTKFGL